MAMENELLKSLGKKPVTLRFPYERAQPVEGIRAKVSWEIEKCIGCTLCVKICPSEAVDMVGRGRNAEITYDIGRCVFCGECVDVCPTHAIWTTKDYELAFTRPREMIIQFKRSKRKRSPSSKE
ncbi:MAG: 4Fe-4S binding protein [Candidatus Bathyarchaeota archaeon]|nr:4Fe-4S binding protein [Candidatus Bathyarchaeota archaeon]